MAALGSSTALFVVSFALSATVCAASLAESMVAWAFDIVMVWKDVLLISYVRIYGIGSVSLDTTS